MSDLFLPTTVPEDYDGSWLREELQRLSGYLSEFAVPTLILIPQHVEPYRPAEGMIVVADGSDWDPGSGAGIYEYLTSSWVKL